MSSLLQQERMMRSKNFSQTCNLLSQYMKENKGSFGPTAMNLSSSAPAPAPVMGVPSPLFYNREANKSMDLFPQRTGFAPTTTTSTETKKPEAAQMTIFYGGKVLVFDNLPVDKAKEVMNFAKNFTPVTSNSVVASKDVLPPRPVQQQQVQQPQQQVQQKQFGDLPIARKASLHRFLEKRKDRINAKAPYQVTGSPITKSGQTQANKVDESKSWLGLASQTGQQWGLAYQL